MGICKTCGTKYSKWTTPVSAKGVCAACFEAELSKELDADPQENVSGGADLASHGNRKAYHADSAKLIYSANSIEGCFRIGNGLLFRGPRTPRIGMGVCGARQKPTSTVLPSW
jgi:hypothetical protein